MAQSSNLDLTKLLPKRYRDKTLDTFLRSLMNRHLTKDESQVLFGFVGDQNSASRITEDIYLPETNLERQVNQLAPVAYAKHATEERAVSWAELVQRLVLLGVPYEEFQEWLATVPFNFVPPIDLDKFCNFNEYFWIGAWVLAHPELDYSSLGMPDTSYILASLARSNAGAVPEYYVIKRGALSGTVPVPPYSPLTQWSDWALNNLWVHRDEVIGFLELHSDVLSLDDITAAKVEVIEFSDMVKLSTYVNGVDEPIDSGGTLHIVQKTRRNQPPLFDLYYYNGDHSKQASCLFYFAESSDEVVDPDVERRIVRDANNDLSFSHGFTDPNTSELLWYKLWNGSSFELKTVWQEGPVETARYVKYDTSGTVINRDKLLNYKNYYWTASTAPPGDLPPYNQAADPEYYVIERGGTSGWSTDNYWTHVSQIRRSDLALYPQALRPIIEFNKLLEPELLEAKTTINQAPRFQLYRFDKVSSSYLTTGYELLAAKGYTQSRLLTRLEDLPETKTAIATDSNLASLLVTVDGQSYVQTLAYGYFTNERDFINYGMTLREVERSSVGNGQVVINSVLDTAYNQVLTLTATSPTSFTVTSDLGIAMPPLTVDVNYAPLVSELVNPDFDIILKEGTDPFVAGDMVRIEVKSVIFNRESLFINLGGIYRTFDAPRDIIDKDFTNLTLVDSLPAQQDGTWKVPTALEDNIDAELRATVGEGDLIYHFASIIDAQPDLLGSANGGNNWRLLPNPDVGLGGKIKQHNGRLALLIGLLLQEGVTPTYLFDYQRDSYEEALVLIKEWVEETLVNDMVAGDAIALSSNLDALDESTYQAMKTYLERQVSIVDTTETPLDDLLARPYYDTTMSVKALTATLPYIGYTPLVQPARELDHEQNFEVITHHDGHRTKLPSIDDDVKKRLVTKKYIRSNGQQSAGTVGGPSFPNSVLGGPRPFAQELYLDLSTMRLYSFNVVTDTGDITLVAPDGSYAFNRESLEVWERIAGSWVSLGNSLAAQVTPWREVDLTETYRALLLRFEQDLYNGCPISTTAALPINPYTTAYVPQMLKADFETWAANNGILDPYASIYDPNNPFTWNFSQAVLPDLVTGIAAWHQVYRSYYGTTRPDLEPWIVTDPLAVDFSDEATFVAWLIVHDDNDNVVLPGFGVLPNGTTSFDPATMWALIETWAHNRLIGLGKVPRLSVNTVTGTLIAPFAFGAPEELLSAIPNQPNKRYSFGELGPIELYWTRTTDHLAALAKAYFKTYPMQCVSTTWGDELVEVSNYEVSPKICTKPGISDVQLHGEAVEPELTADFIDALLVAPPAVDTTVVLEVASVIYGSVVLRVTVNGVQQPYNIGPQYVDAVVDVTINRPRTGLIVGDKVTVVATALGALTYTVEPATIRKLEGLSQLYVHYHRTSGKDLSINSNETWLREWSAKLAYRFNTLIDTDTFKVTRDGETVDSSTYSVLLKELEFIHSAWLTAFRVTLLKVGSTERVGQKLVPADQGADWVFRVDGYNPRRPQVEWWEFDTVNGSFQTFFALNARNSKDEWKHYLTKTTLRKANAPFIVTGIQNLISFIFGYLARLEELGFQFNDDENPLLDPTTGRMIGWQLQVEQFVDQQYAGVPAGSAFLFDPFQQKLWFNTPFGFLADLTRRSDVVSNPLSGALLDQNGRQLKNGSFRVFRQDSLAQVTSDVPLYGAHFLTSAHEHYVLFNDYSEDGILLYDGFLGQQVDRLFFSGEQQASPTGRVSYGGKFLVSGEMRKNMEATIQGLLKLYDSTNTRLNDPAVERARALLGFEHKTYWDDRGTPDQTEFRFWQGAIKAKGTNEAVLAYINAKSYQTASLDEYWAYKIAEYGDARPIIEAEMQVEPDDCQTERTPYLFLEPDELLHIKDYWANGGYDVPLLDVTPIDAFSIYSSEQWLGVDGYFDARGMILITPDDQSRWFRFDDLRTLKYFEADPIGETVITPLSTTACYVITDIKGKPVRADCFELFDANYIAEGDAYDILPYDTGPFDEANQERHFEMGDLIPGSDPPEYSPPKFKRLNMSTIQILDESLLDRVFKVVAYGPAISKYSPNRVFDYVSNTTIKDDIIWWDPARGSHHPEAHKEVDYVLDYDPAKYNEGRLRVSNHRADPQKPWGAGEVGKIWWDTKYLQWLPYSDTKQFTEMQERLARWGGLADYSQVLVYEWVKSTVPPESYIAQADADGEPGYRELVKRVRAWWQRPVAWRFSTNPSMLPLQFLAYQPDQLKITVANGRGRIVLKSGDFKSLGFTVGSKISAARYTSPTTRDDTTLDHIFGLAKVTSTAADIVVGPLSGFDEGATFVLNSNITSMSLTPNVSRLLLRDSYLGRYYLSNSFDGSTSTWSLTLNYLVDGTFQTLTVGDSPTPTGGTDTYDFDRMGMKFSFTSSFPPSTPQATREAAIAQGLGNFNHDIVLRSSATVIAPIDFTDTDTVTYTVLGGPSTTLGWIAWNDPTTNPNTGAEPPLSKWEPFAGDWTLVNGALIDVEPEIKVRMADRWTWFDTLDYTPYKSVWGPWRLDLDAHREKRYCTGESAFFTTNFAFPGYTALQLSTRLDVYLNEQKLRTDQYSIDDTGASPVMQIDEGVYSKGDLIRTILRAVPPTAKELAFNPDVSDLDPLILTQRGWDYPYVSEQVRAPSGSKTQTVYYYWVKNRLQAAPGNKMATTQIASLLRDHNGTYSVPQVFKFYNQVDGRPNRYGFLSVKLLSRLVRKADTYKMRMTRDPTLRTDDHDMNLKNTHEEWVLLRQYQNKLIPRELWDRLTDTVCGENSIGQDLPLAAYVDYDQHNEGAFASYGLSPGQLMTDPATAIATIKGTILNTGVTKYDTVTGALVPDPIAYTGFDIEQLDTYFATPAAARSFMGELWISAKPKQVNELFFAVLHDALVKSPELAKVFKTSFISLSEVRTIESGVV